MSRSVDDFLEIKDINYENSNNNRYYGRLLRFNKSL